MKKNTFIINKSKIKENYDSYKEFKNIYYTLKTNSNKKILEILNEVSNEKILFSISSITHFELLESLNVNPNRICVINTFLGEDDLKYLYKKGIRKFTFSNLKDIKRFEKFADEDKVSLNIRLNISELTHENYYIGANIAEYNKIFEYAKTKYKEVGLSYYLPQANKAHHFKMILILKNINNFNKDYIVAGGIPVAKELLDMTPDRDIHLEIGQNLLAGAVDLEMNIIKNNDNNFILSNGLYGGFLDKILYNKKYTFYIIHQNKKIYLKEVFKIKHLPVNLFGPSCDTLDSLGTYYLDLHEMNIFLSKKIIYVENVGAYFEEFFTNYNNDIPKGYRIIEEDIYEV